jgi:hypothetical protein
MWCIVYAAPEVVMKMIDEGRSLRPLQNVPICITIVILSLSNMTFNKYKVKLSLLATIIWIGVAYSKYLDINMTEVQSPQPWMGSSGGHP